MLKPLILFDGSCPLCRREISHYQRLDKRNRIIWQDIHQAGSLLQHHNITTEQAMRSLHALDGRGKTRTGVAAFLLIWDHLPGYRWLSAIIRAVKLQSLLEKLYRRFAGWRYRRRCSTGK